MKKSLLIILSYSVIYIYSCSSNTAQEELQEGTIEYEVSYPNVNKNDVMLAMMLPKKMILNFKNGNTYSEIGTGAIFKTIIISNKESQSGFQLLKIVNKKYILKLDSIGIQDNAFSIFNEVKIVPLSETKEIAGYMCKKASVETATGKQFDIYYCPTLGTKGTNWYNPYKEIEGMIMEYQYKQYNLDMKFVATKVTPNLIKDDIFLEPNGYESITKEKMAEIFENF